MNHLLRYKKYLESLDLDPLTWKYDQVDIMESLGIWHDVLLSSIGAQEVDIFDTLKIPKEKFNGKIDVSYLSDNVEFFNALSSIGLKKSSLQSTEDFETFINKPCKFMLIYDFNANELENPEYILFQTWNESLKKWEEAKLFKVEGEIKLFFDKLSSKTIEIQDGGENFIYTTSNGNDWELQNLPNENDQYPRFLTKEDLQKVIDTRKVKLSII